MPRKTQDNSTAANLGFEAKLWQAADALRNNMDAAEYKHVVLGLIFLKYISDAFEANHAELEAEKAQGADPEDPDEYRAVNIFWVPKEARWQHLKANAPQPTIGTLVDDAMSAIERDNPSLKGVLPKDYARPGLDKQRLGQLINLVSDIALGSPADRAKDTLGRVYEYFLAQFASAEGKKGGQFYTPSHVVRVLVEMLAPYKGRVYDPCCGSGGMFISSEKFIEADLVDCMVALPGQLFYSTPIPVCLWFLVRNKRNGRFRDRRGETLFIDARKLGSMVDRTHRELTVEDVDKIAGAYHAWRRDKDAVDAQGSASAAGGRMPGAAEYADIAGFCKSATLEEIRKHGQVLTPGRYVGAEAQEDDGEPFEEKMKRLTATLRQQQGEAVKLDAAIAANLKELGYGG